MEGEYYQIYQLSGKCTGGWFFRPNHFKCAAMGKKKQSIKPRRGTEPDFNVSQQSEEQPHGKYSHLFWPVRLRSHRFRPQYQSQSQNESFSSVSPSQPHPPRLARLFQIRKFDSRQEAVYTFHPAGELHIHYSPVIKHQAQSKEQAFQGQEQKDSGSRDEAKVKARVQSTNQKEKGSDAGKVAAIQDKLEFDSDGQYQKREGQYEKKIKIQDELFESFDDIPASFQHSDKQHKTKPRAVVCRQDLDYYQERDEQSYYNSENQQNQNNRPGCSCSDSGCLKFYCICFGKGDSCTKNCSCRNCHNIFVNRGYQSRIKINASVEKLIQCKCTRNKCLKKYCQCRSANSRCSDRCQCVGCQNSDKFVLENRDLVAQILKEAGGA